MDFLTAHGASLLFYLFAALTVGGAIGVVTLRSPMYGAISLLVTFLSVAVLFLLRSAEFVGMVQIFVYGGGIMVLFLFVIMLVNLHKLPDLKLFHGQSPFVVALAVALLALFSYFFVHVNFPAAFARPEVFTTVPGVAASSNSQAVALSLFQQQLLPFEIASVFLLVAMIGAVVLGRRQ
ncbi:MAG: NADH-quinone oxidoreductase subunit [Acidobacteriota bacterium]|jgi:NADH-quinone oxidoreductase subunit J|nr:NADH-quinone oxidoreductase subunit [Acidobacteriota bacterium]